MWCALAQSMLYRFLYLFSTITKISWCCSCFALWECVWERFVHGGMSQWGPLRDMNRESIISRLCSVEPLGRVGSDHLIQSFSSTMVHYTIRKYKSHLPCRRRWKLHWCGWGGGSAATAVGPLMCSTSGSLHIYLPSEHIVALFKNIATRGATAIFTFPIQFAEKNRESSETVIYFRSNSRERETEKTGKEKGETQRRIRDEAGIFQKLIFFRRDGNKTETMMKWIVSTIRQCLKVRGSRQEE